MACKNFIDFIWTSTVIDPFGGDSQKVVERIVV